MGMSGKVLPCALKGHSSSKQSSIDFTHDLTLSFESCISFIGMKFMTKQLLFSMFSSLIPGLLYVPRYRLLTRPVTVLHLYIGLDGDDLMDMA